MRRYPSKVFARPQPLAGLSLLKKGTLIVFVQNYRDHHP
jgi:hypothetical protein